MVLPFLQIGGTVIGIGAQRAAERRASAQALAAEQRANDMNLALYQRGRADSEADYARARADALSDVDQQFVRLRAAAEKGGFNPLAVLQGIPGGGMPAVVSKSSPGVPQAASYVPGAPAASGSMIASAVSDIGLMLADRLGRSASARQAANLQTFQANKQRALQRAEQVALRPKVGGVYASGQGAPRLRENGGGDVSGARGGSSGVGPSWPVGQTGWSAGRAGAALTDSDAADTRREVEHGKIVTDVGLMKMDNPNGDPFYVPAAGGQPLDKDQYFSIGLGYLGTRAFEYYTRNNPMSWGADGYPDGGKPGVPVPSSVYDMRLAWGVSKNRFPPFRERLSDSWVWRAGAATRRAVDMVGRWWGGETHPQRPMRFREVRGQ